jgi:hypothetical protein
MFTQEMMQAAAQDRLREAARLQRESEALQVAKQRTRRAPVRSRIRLPLPAFVTQRFRTASVS